MAPAYRPPGRGDQGVRAEIATPSRRGGPLTGLQRRGRAVVSAALKSRVLYSLLGATALIVVFKMPSWPHVPTYGLMLSPFGIPVNYQTCGFHTGQDWFAPEGTPVFAVEDGLVVHVGPLWLSGGGAGRGEHSIVIEHAEYTSTYSHNRVAFVQPGERVERGDLIAEIGNEGYSRRPHLHLEKVTAPYSGSWRMPFIGCTDYEDPGWLWGLW